MVVNQLYNAFVEAVSPHYFIFFLKKKFKMSFRGEFLVIQ